MSDQPRTPTEQPVALRVLAKAMSTKVNLAVGGAGVVVAAAVQSVPVFALGALAYAALVAWDFANPAFAKAARGREPVALPDPSGLRDAAVRDAIDRLAAAQIELDRVLEELPRSVTEHLSSVRASADSMRTYAAAFALRADALAAYLARNAADAVPREIAKLDRQIAATRDAEARGQYESARALRIEQAKALDDIGDARERIVANLTRIVATVEALPAKMVRLRALDGQAIDKLTGNINAELESVNGDLAAFEEVLTSLSEANE